MQTFLFRSLFYTAFAIAAVGALFFPHDVRAQTGAALKLAPPSGTFFAGSTFDVSIVLDTGPQAVNAVAVELQFPPNVVQVANPAAGSSIVSIWATPPTFSNAEGTVRLQGGIPSPGVKTDQGVVTVLTFRAVAPGRASLVFSGESQVLANDGRGTNILSFTQGATYQIELPPPQGPQVSSPTHPDQDTWYRSRTGTVAWIGEEGVETYAWHFDRDHAGEVDTDNPQGPATAAAFEDLEDGLWYFHIRARKAGKWGGLTTFLIRIDGAPPAAFTPEFLPGEVTNEKRPLVNFVTTDAHSGINRYEVRVIPTRGNTAASEGVGTPFFVAAQSPYRLPELSEGGYDVIVRAYDNAGNVQEVIGHLEIVSGVVGATGEGVRFGTRTVPWWVALLVGMGFLALAVFLVRRQRHRHAAVQEKLAVDVTRVRERLQQNLEQVSRRLAEDEAARAQLVAQLERLNQGRGAGDEKGKVQDKNGAGRSDGGYIRRSSIFFVALAVLGLFAAGTATKTVFPPSAFSQEEVVQGMEQEESLPAPIITTFRGKLGSDEMVYLGGEAPAHSTVRIFIASRNQEPLVAETRADDQGRWSYLHDRFLQPGLYEITAQAQDDDGNISRMSPRVAVEVLSRTFTAGNVTVSHEVVFAVANLLLALIAGMLGVFALRFNRKAKQLQKRLVKEIIDAETITREGFTLLRRDLVRELELLGSAKFPSRKISKEEQTRRRQLIADIEAIEGQIRAEVEDIMKAL